jgi:membrane protease YdiL (CAAX protease family)
MELKGFFRTAPWWMLLSRLALFLVFQAVFAAVLLLAGTADPWGESARWWPFAVLFTNIVCIGLLYMLFKREGKRYFEFAQFHKESILPDLLIVVLLIPFVMVFASVPSQWLAGVLLGSYEKATAMFFQPLPLWAVIIALAFPITHAFAELPVYFGYAMPRIEQATKNGWFAWGISSLFLALQHVTLPLIFDGNFLLWRALNFIPFALFMGAVIKLRPRLFPYLMIGHAAIDMMLVLMYFSL